MNNTRNIKFATILTVVVLFIGILVGAFFAIQAINVNNRRESLMAKIEEYQQLPNDKEGLVAKRNLYAQLEQEARALGLIAQDETLFELMEQTKDE